VHSSHSSSSCTGPHINCNALVITLPSHGPSHVKQQEAVARTPVKLCQAADSLCERNPIHWISGLQSLYVIRCRWGSETCHSDISLCILYAGVELIHRQQRIKSVRSLLNLYGKSRYAYSSRLSEIWPTAFRRRTHRIGVWSHSGRSFLLQQPCPEENEDAADSIDGRHGRLRHGTGSVRHYLRSSEATFDGRSRRCWPSVVAVGNHHQETLQSFCSGSDRY